MITQIAINGLSMGRGTNYLLLDAQGFGSGDIRKVQFDIPGRHRALVPRAFWSARKMSFTIRVKGNNAANHESNRKDLFEALDLPRFGLSTLTFSTVGGDNYQIEVQLDGPIDAPFQPSQITFSDIRIQFVAPDPVIYGQNQISTNIYLASPTGVHIPATIPIQLESTSNTYLGYSTVLNDGSAPSYPTIRIYGPVTNPDLRNATTGKTWSIVYTLTAGQFIDIDMWNETVLLNGVTNILNSVDGEFWYLAAGSNTVFFSADNFQSEARANVTHRNGHLGI